MTPHLARLAWVAVRLDEQATEEELPQWSPDAVGISVPIRAARDAVRPLRPASPRTGRPPSGERPSVRRTPALWEWLRIDAYALGVVEVFFEVPNPAWLPRSELVPSLSGLHGITHVIETKAGGDVFALGVVRDEREADDLASRVQELVPGQGVRMRRVARRTEQPARATWRELARREAA